MKRENGIESQLMKAQDDAKPCGADAQDSGQAVMASVVSSVLTFKSAQSSDAPLKPDNNENDGGPDDGLNLDSPSVIGRAVRQMLYEMDENAIFLDPPEVFDDAILGTTENQSGPVCVIYDSEKCIDLLMSHNDWDREEAMEFFSFNVSGAHGEGFPIFLCRPMDMDVDMDVDMNVKAVTNPHALNESEPRALYTTKVEVNPETGDHIIKLPDELLKAMDWRIGDRINIEPMAHGGCTLSNLSLAARKSGASSLTSV